MSGSQPALGCNCPSRTEAPISPTKLQSPPALIGGRLNERANGQQRPDYRLQIGCLDVALSDQRGARDGQGLAYKREDG